MFSSLLGGGWGEVILELNPMTEIIRTGQDPRNLNITYLYLSPHPEFAVCRSCALSGSLGQIHCNGQESRSPIIEIANATSALIRQAKADANCLDP